jgi:streptogramin lyase
VAALLVTLACVGTAAAADGDRHPRHGYGPPPRQNPATAPNGFGFMHGDSASSDTTPVAGPGTGPISATSVSVGGVCASVVVGQDGYPVAVCTQVSTRQPTAYLIDPQTGQSLASYSVAKGSSLLGGVYVYIDSHDRLVIADGDNQLLRLAHTESNGTWSFKVASRLSIAGPVRRECGSDNCDTTVGLAPDYAGRVWFATVGGIVGYADPRTHHIRSVHLPRGRGDRRIRGVSATPDV